MPAEPTSALDHESAVRVEQVLKDSGAGLIWVTHDSQQPSRVGGRVLSLPLGTEVIVNVIQNCFPIGGCDKYFQITFLPHQSDRISGDWRIPVASWWLVPLLFQLI
jgi:ABC-type cobalamin/Fe3+-siderophores transport system ATPase subunit